MTWTCHVEYFVYSLKEDMDGITVHQAEECDISLP
uniref:Uncharacterized protein n=1 Tax=Arundo donax TaxID=35708 RepID=A0A0A9GKT0_ARUDO